MILCVGRRVAAFLSVGGSVAVAAAAAATFLFVGGRVVAAAAFFVGRMKICSALFDRSREKVAAF